MLTETEARSLLHQAADTIEVGPGVPFAEPPRRHHGIVAVAAAVALLVAVTGLVVWRAHRSPPVDRPHGMTMVPNLVGYRTAAASDALRAAGLAPRIRTRASCEDAGRTLRTDPLAGTKVRRGTAVVVTAASDTTLRCPFSAVDFARSRAWELVDLARGLPGPRFADQVQLGVDSQPLVTVSATEAADPTRWPACDDSEPSCAGTALDVIRQALDGAVSSDRFLVQPRLLVDPTSNDGSTFRLYVGTGELGAPSFPRWSVSEQLDPDGAVTGVHLDYRQGSGPLHATTGHDPTGVGRRFVDFALGRSDSFPMDTPVALYLGNVHRRTLSTGRALDRQAWHTCVPYAGQSCPRSAVATIAAYERTSGEPVRLSGRDTAISACLAHLGPPPTGTGGSHVVVIAPSGRRTCLNDFRIELWINDVGEIVAVNELLSEP